MLDIDIIATIKFKCPHCGEEGVETWIPSPYKSMEDDPIDVDCKKCKEFITLQI